jgi:hypothetical protein
MLDNGNFHRLLDETQMTEALKKSQRGCSTIEPAAGTVVQTMGERKKKGRDLKRTSRLCSLMGLEARIVRM